MTSTNLKLGNLIWVLHEESESVKIVDLSVLDDFVYNEEDPLDYDDRFARRGFNYAPIPLTEEWLLKLGFGVNRPETAWWNEHEFLISKDKDGFYFGIWRDVNDDPYVEHVCDIKYVHELQNLHHLIIGKEL